MYCKKCGTQIDNDSEFCRKCGAKTTPITKANNVPVKESEEGSGVSFFVKFLIIVTIIFSIIVGIGFCVNSKDEKSNSKNNSYNNTTKDPIKQLITRDANIYDIEYETETNLKKLGIDIIIHPNCDIEDLEIKIEILDGDKKVIDTIYKNIGNVKEGVEITRTVSITDMSIINTLKTRYYRIVVVGGTVSYFD